MSKSSAKWTRPDRVHKQLFNLDPAFDARKIRRAVRAIKAFSVVTSNLRQLPSLAS